MTPEAGISDVQDPFLARHVREVGRRVGSAADVLIAQLRSGADAVLAAVVRIGEAAQSWWRHNIAPQPPEPAPIPDAEPCVETAMAPPTPAVRVEDKLFYNRYLVDAGRAHIRVRPHTVPSPQLLSLLKACPARCYDLNEKGQVEITVDGCVECGTCRIIGEPTGDIEWHYPRGGYGVLFKFG